MDSKNIHSEGQNAQAEAPIHIRAALDALLAAAKLVVMESANLIGETVLSGPASDALNEAIELAGGWTSEEQEKLDALALGEAALEPSEEEIADMTAWAEDEERARAKVEADEEDGRRDAALRAEEEAIANDPEEP